MKWTTMITFAPELATIEATVRDGIQCGRPRSEVLAELVARLPTIVGPTSDGYLRTTRDLEHAKRYLLLAWMDHAAIPG